MPRLAAILKQENKGGINRTSQKKKKKEKGVRRSRGLVLSSSWHHFSAVPHVCHTT